MGENYLKEYRGIYNINNLKKVIFTLIFYSLMTKQVMNVINNKFVKIIFLLIK